VLVDLNKATMYGSGSLRGDHVGMGVLIAVVIEILFKIVGVKGERIEIHH